MEIGGEANAVGPYISEPYHSSWFILTQTIKIIFAVSLFELFITLSGCRGWLLRCSNYFLCVDIGLFRYPFLLSYAFYTGRYTKFLNLLSSLFLFRSFATHRLRMYRCQTFPFYPLVVDNTFRNLVYRPVSISQLLGREFSHRKSERHVLHQRYNNY